MFNKIFKKYCRYNLKSESWYRKFVIESLDKEKVTECYDKYQESLVFEETTDMIEKDILNFR